LIKTSLFVISLYSKARRVVFCISSISFAETLRIKESAILAAWVGSLYSLLIFAVNPKRLFKIMWITPL